MMPTLQLGSYGSAVAVWQKMVGCMPDGHFGPMTQQATRDWQQAHGLVADGVVGPMSWWEAEPWLGVDVPFTPAQRVQAFGAFSYVPAPNHAMPEAIRITDGWDLRNIVLVHMVQLRGLVGAPESCRVPWHKRVVSQLLDLWQHWERAQFLPRIRTWDGSYVPRCVRGSTTVLSNHAFGSAFDINARHIPQGSPIPDDWQGLIDIAKEHGFCNGSIFHKSDPMHFEVNRLLS